MPTAPCWSAECGATLGNDVNLRDIEGRSVLLFLGTRISPIQDRDGEGQGFSHHVGDTVTIATPSRGALVNRVDRSDRLPLWTVGIRQWHAYMARRR